MTPLIEVHDKQLRLPLGESKIYYHIESPQKAVGDVEGGGSQVVKQHTTTLSASMNKFRKKLASQKQIMSNLKQEWDTVQAEICKFTTDWERESMEEDVALEADIDECVKGWEEEIKAAGDQGIRRCQEVEEKFVRSRREVTASFRKLMEDDDD